MSKKKPTETLRLLLIAVMQQAYDEECFDAYYAVKNLYEGIWGKDSTF